MLGIYGGHPNIFLDGRPCQGRAFSTVHFSTLALDVHPRRPSWTSLELGPFYNTPSIIIIIIIIIIITFDVPACSLNMNLFGPTLQALIKSWVICRQLRKAYMIVRLYRSFSYWAIQLYLWTLLSIIRFFKFNKWLR